MQLLQAYPGDARAAVVEAEFLDRYPAYAATRHVDALRAVEYRRFDAHMHTYLDYTGGSVYAESQLRAHTELLQQTIFGNPHSGNPPSLAMTDVVERGSGVARATGAHGPKLFALPAQSLRAGCQCKPGTREADRRATAAAALRE
jgi:hypothetical protein